MKNLIAAKKIRRGTLLLACVLFSVSSGFSVPANSLERINFSSSSRFEVTDAEVIEYLERFGYHVYQLVPEGGESENKIAYTQYEYLTIVYIESGQIIGHDDFNP